MIKRPLTTQTIKFLLLATLSIGSYCRSMQPLDTETHIKFLKYLKQHSINELNSNELRDISAEMHKELCEIPAGEMLSSPEYALILDLAGNRMNELKKDPHYKEALLTALATRYLSDASESKDNYRKLAETNCTRLYATVKDYLSEKIWSHDSLPFESQEIKAAVLVQFWHRHLRDEALNVQ